MLQLLHSSQTAEAKTWDDATGWTSSYFDLYNYENDYDDDDDYDDNDYDNDYDDHDDDDAVLPTSSNLIFIYMR